MSEKTPWQAPGVHHLRTAAAAEGGATKQQAETNVTRSGLPSGPN